MEQGAARFAAAEPDDLMGNWRGWSAKLSRPIQLKDGTQLQTLADVRGFISGQPEHIQERTFWRYATQLLIDAADGGDIEAVTNEVELALFLSGDLVLR